MFDLNREVAAWSEAVHADRCRRAGSVAELTDHLYCEIDRGRTAGLSDEQAFAAAVEKLGAAPQLQAEHAKNRTLVQTACAVLMRYERGAASRLQRRLLTAHALLWGALMLVWALLSAKSTAPAASGWMLIGVLMPCWWASELILRRALRVKPTGA
jgi:hypothetical protein